MFTHLKEGTQLMAIYTELSEPVRLYIKKCSHCGLKYFGKTKSKDIESYPGSGTYWTSHLKKHAAKSIHVWNSDWYYDESIARFALKFSRINKIVQSDLWANLKEENGLEGGTFPGSTLPFSQRYSKERADEIIQKRKLSFERISFNADSKNPMFDKRWINDGVVNQLIGSGEVIPAGYNLGRIQNNASKIGYIWCNNGIVNKQIKCLDDLPDGFKIGMMKSVIWINDGKVNRMINSNEQIPSGFFRGKIMENTKHRNTTWVNDGKTNKRLPFGEKVPEGFVVGLLKKQIRNGERNDLPQTKLQKHSVLKQVQYQSHLEHSQLPE